MPTPHHRAPRPLWLTLLAGTGAAIGAGLLIACSNTTGGGGIRAEAIDRGPAPGEDPDDYAAQIQADVAAMRAALAEKNAERERQTASSPTASAPTTRPPRPEPVVSESAPTAANIGTSVTIEEAAPIEDAAPVDAVVTAEPTLEEQLTLAADDLASALRRRAEGETSPFGTLVALGSLDLITPGLGAAPQAAGALTGAEDRALAAWRSAMSQASSELQSGGGPEALERLATNLLETMHAERTLHIGRFALCTRVDGFGQYAEFETTAFLARRAHRAIVYVEVGDFMAAPAADANGVSGHRVELTQGVSLYHADGTLAWRQTDQETTDFSRNQRRDFFVVQRIELPETLTVGSYNLKVTMRDKATGAVAEQTMPLTIVADASLTRPQSGVGRR